MYEIACPNSISSNVKIYGIIVDRREKDSDATLSTKF